MNKRVSLEHGALMVEAGISMGLFMLLLITGTKLITAAYIWSALYDTLNVGAQLGVLGESTADEVKNVIIQTAAAFSVEITSSDIHICPPKNIATDGYSCIGNDDLGIPGQVMHYAIILPFPLFSLAGNDGLVLRTVLLTRNE